MKKKTFKRIWWIAGLAIALLLPLTVLPKLEYKVEGPWGTGITKRSEGFDSP